jgi:hypothetical protein
VDDGLQANLPDHHVDEFDKRLSGSAASERRLLSSRSSITIWSLFNGSLPCGWRFTVAGWA